MSVNFLVVVTGAPASGKTKIAEKLSEDFKIPLVRKDEFKELLFDSLGWSDREWSRKLGATTYRLMFNEIGRNLDAGRSLIIEANFEPEENNKTFQELQEKYDLPIFQIHCHAPLSVLSKRFRERVETGSRHPGHVDEINYKIFDDPNLLKDFATLSVKGEVVEVDSTEDFNNYYPEIKEKLTRFKTGSL